MEPEFSGRDDDRRRPSRRRLLIGTAAGAAGVAVGTGANARPAAAATVPTPNWVNVMDNGAVGDGVTDDTDAINAVLKAAESSNGTVVYLPSGTYLVSGLSYSGSAPLTIIGDGCGIGTNTGLSFIQGSTAATGTSILSITNSTTVELLNFGVLGAMAAPASASDDTYTAINLSSCNYVRITKMYVCSPEGGKLVNVAVKTDSGVKNFMCDDLCAWANLYGYWMNGSSQCSVRNANIGTIKGNGGAAFHMDNGAGTLRLTNCQTDQGDYGFWMRANGGGDPDFVFMNDVEFNNYSTVGMRLDNGSEVWASQCWVSGAGDTGDFPDNGVAVGTDFVGVAYFKQCAFQANGEHTVMLEAGSGYGFTDCVFGSWGKDSANSWDELHIGGAVSCITVTGCHFNTDPYYGMGSPAPRSAIWIGDGASAGIFTANLCGDGYGTSGRCPEDSMGVWTGNSGGW